VIYKIAFSPFHTPPSPGTATFVRTGPPGSTCSGIAWDVIDERVYQSSSALDGGEGEVLVFHFPETSGNATPVKSGCFDPVSGLAVAGSRLFAACGSGAPDNGDVNEVHKTSGTPATAFSANTPGPQDIECDPVSFVLAQSWHSEKHQDVVWVKDGDPGNANKILAVQAPFGTCGPVPPPSFNLAVCDADGDGAPDDSDGDGLFDCWEDGKYWTDGLPGIALNGFYPDVGGGAAKLDPAVGRFTLCVDANDPPNGIDIATECARPKDRDAFLEIDYMKGHRPIPGAVADVVAAFANAPKFSDISGKCNADACRPGIRLHVLINEEIPHVNLIALVPGTGPALPGDPLVTGTVDFDKIKAGTAFTPPAGGLGANANERANAAMLAARTLVFRYALFAHNQIPIPPSTTNTSSGLAEVLGNDSVITMGSWTVPTPQPAGHVGGVGSRIEQGGTLIHEFGHNLGLRHAGVGNIPNCLVNYPSSMNYSLQTLSGRLPDYSKNPRCTGGPGSPPGCVLDVNECSVSEAAGIGLYTGKVVYGPRSGIPPKPKTIDYTANAPLNYDQDNNPSETYTRDLNHTTAAGGSCAPSVPSPPNVCDVHQGFDDWANIQLNFRASADFLDGVTNTDGNLRSVRLSIDADKNAGTLDLTYEESRQMSADAIDIKPNDRNNTLNRNSSQVVAVAMLSRPTATDGTDPGFDARDIDHTTVIFRGVGAATWQVSAQDCNVRDVNQDRLPDLVCTFDMTAGLLSLGEKEAAIEATFGPGDEPFSGIDSIRVQP
jgi:hypothetical protein